jgi:hypothetical protein
MFDWLSRFRYLGQQINPSDILPHPSDVNDLHSHNLLGTTPLNTFTLVSGSPTDSIPPIIGQIGVQTRPGLYYDTGVLNDITFTPGKIVLDNDPQLRNRGNVFFNLPGDPGSNYRWPVSFQSGAHALLPMETKTLVQTHFDLFSPNAQNLLTRRAYVRAVAGEHASPGDSYQELLLGKSDPLFGDYGSAPKTLFNGAPVIGMIAAQAQSTGGYQGIPELRYTYHMALDPHETLEASLAIDQQSVLNDWTVTAAASKTQTVVHDYPIFTGRSRYNFNDGHSSIQFAALVRPMGSDDEVLQHHSATGWGLSTIGSFVIDRDEQMNLLLVSAAGGRAIGGYIFGGTPAAIVSTSSIRLLGNAGFNGSYQRYWWRSPDNSRFLTSYFTYGFVGGQAVDQVTNTRLHQVSCNLFWQFSDNAQVGVEYDYGRRIIGSGRDGEDNRIWFVFSATTAGSKDTAKTAEYRGTAAPAGRNRSFLRL